VRDIRPNLKPGEAEPWEDSLRYRRLRDGKLVVDARVWNALRGGPVTATHDNLADAKKWQTEQKTGRIHGQEVDPQLNKLPFAEIAARWLMSKPSKGKGSCETDKDRLKGTGVVLEIDGEGMDRVVITVGKPTKFAAQPIGRIKTADVNTLVDGWKLTHAPNTVAGMYSTMRAVFSWAETTGAIGKRNSPCRDVVDVPKWHRVERPVHRPDDADQDEYIAVKSVSNDDLIALADALGEDYDLAVWLGVCFGLRYEEAFGLTVESVEGLMQGVVRVTQVVDRQGKLRPKTVKATTKTEAGERYIIDRILNARISDHMNRRGLTLNSPPDTLLFVNARDGGPLTYNAWHKIWRKALVRAGLDWKKRNGQRLGLHDLRSMNRSIMNKAGVDPTTARKRFGHAGTREEQLDDLYSKTSPAQIREASERIHTIVRMAPREASGETVGTTVHKPYIEGGSL
jgi:hypothetical protein